MDKGGFDSKLRFMKKWWPGEMICRFKRKEEVGQVFEISIVVVDILLTTINEYLVPMWWASSSSVFAFKHRLRRQGQRPNHR